MGQLSEIATKLSIRLSDTGRRIVFAESCTCGMVACELGKIPGASAWLCGSFVTYRSSAKIEWLDVDPTLIQRHSVVSDPVAMQMAAGALSKTAEADIAISITGHFGPDAPDGFDGVVFIGLANRGGARIAPEVLSERHVLENTNRLARQIDATRLVIETALSAIDH